MSSIYAMEVNCKPVIIQISYSLLNIHRQGWRIGRQDLETYRKQLFDSARLSFREKLFRLVTIPSLQAMLRKSSGQNLRVLVYTSLSLPPPFLQNLHTLVDELGCGEVLGIEEHEKFRYPDVIPRVLCKMADVSEVQRRLTFAAVRIDDDDALSSNYIDRLSQYISQSYSGFAVSFGRGYVGHFDNQAQKFVRIRDVYQPMSSRGLAAICTYDMASRRFSSTCASAFMLGEHPTVDRRFPTIIDSREPVFFASEHTQQDTKHNTDKLTLSWNLKQLVKKYSSRNNPDEMNKIDIFRGDKTFMQDFGYLPLID